MNIDSLNKNDPSNEQDYNSLLKKIDFVIDTDFLDFIKSHNGAEGFINDEDYIILWNVADLIALNPYYKDIKECEAFFFFGSDGSNLGYAFEKKTNSVIAIDFLEISENNPKTIASSFEMFINKMVNRLN